MELVVAPAAFRNMTKLPEFLAGRRRNILAGRHATQRSGRGAEGCPILRCTWQMSTKCAVNDAKLADWAARSCSAGQQSEPQ